MSPSLLFETATSLFVQITLLVGYALIVDRCRDSARRSGQIWTTTFVASLLLTLVAFLLPHVRWFPLPSFDEPSTLGTVLRIQIFAARLLLAIWLIGFSISLLRRICRFLTLVHFFSVRCLSLSERQIASLPHDIVSRAPESTRWLLSDQTHGPFCWQLHRPTIVLPASIFQLDSEMQRHILRHELEHLSVGHPLQHFLQGFCNTLLWFHPAVRFAAHRAELTREYWCDEVAAQCREGVAGYLRSLATICEQNADAPPYTLAIGRRGSAIVRRSNRLARLMKCRDWKPGQEDSPMRLGFSSVSIVMAAALLAQLWLPVNLLASGHDRFSPWPAWSASVLHDVGLTVRDYESFDHRREAHEILNPDSE
ncbi:MAG: M56 family metallopeptidase [Phycisphaera sp. RhM]|nr:M56 family metallopeptidase [Phycisphaera sp. RhM]